MIGKPSQKFKYIQGEPTYAPNMMYQDLSTPLAGVEGHQIAANTRYVAIPWKGNGGNFCVRTHDDQGRIRLDAPQYKGHSGPIQDLDFSPFHENLLATASSDSTLRLWQMPTEKMTANIEKCEAVMRGHSKKVMLMQWHPAAEMTLASAGQAGGVRIWDVQMEKTMFDYQGNKHLPWSMSWNHDGSLLTLFTKERKFHVIDPRTQTSVAINDAHQGPKAQRVTWKGSHGLQISVGTGDMNDREYMVYDPRNWSKPVQKTQLDNNSQVAWIHYDDVTNLFFVTNKGSTFTQMMYFSDKGERGSVPELIPLSNYDGKEGTHYFSFLPKQAVDPFRKELVRGLRFTGKNAQFITFRVPRKGDDFSQDLYPQHRAMSPALTFDEWSKGGNKTPLLEGFDPEKLQSQIKEKIQTAFTFTKKPGAGSTAPQAAPSKASASAGGASSAESAAQISSLEKDVSQQKSIISSHEQTIKDLQEKLKAAEANSSAAAAQDGPAQLEKPLFGYFDIRGQAQPIRYLLGYLDVDHDEITYTQEDLGGNLPQMPFFKDKKGQTHEDTLKIMKHLASTYKPELMPQSEDQNINFDMIKTYLEQLNQYIVEYCYGKPQEVALNDGLYEKLAPIISFMKQQQTRCLLSDNLCFIDFYLYECIELLDFMTSGQVYSDYPELYNHSSMMASVLEPFFSKNHASLSYPFFHRFTQYNNWPEVDFKKR